MTKFCDFGLSTHVVIGKSIEINELFGRRILIERTIIKPTKFPGKNASGMRMQMQVCLAGFDDDGEYERDEYGCPIGERRSCFTGSDILIDSIMRVEKIGIDQNASVYPLDTTIVRTGKCFQFT